MYAGAFHEFALGHGAKAQGASHFFDRSIIWEGSGKTRNQRRLRQIRSRPTKNEMRPPKRPAPTTNRSAHASKSRRVSHVGPFFEQWSLPSILGDDRVKESRRDSVPKPKVVPRRGQPWVSGPSRSNPEAGCGGSRRLNPLRDWRAKAAKPKRGELDLAR